MKPLKINNVKSIDVDDWNKFVTETYGRPYNFQQQDDCKGNHTSFEFTVPDEANDYENDTLPEEVNHEEMGVSFSAWLKRDPKTPLKGEEDCPDYCIEMWWERNFYPDVQMIANDLHVKGLLEEGEYVIHIWW